MLNIADEFSDFRAVVIRVVVGGKGRQRTEAIIHSSASMFQSHFVAVRQWHRRRGKQQMLQSFLDPWIRSSAHEVIVVFWPVMSKAFLYDILRRRLGNL